MSDKITTNDILFTPAYKEILKSYSDRRNEAVQSVIQSEVEFRNGIDGLKAEKLKRGIDSKEQFNELINNLHYLETQRVPSYLEVMSKIPKSVYLGYKLSGVSMGRIITDVVETFYDPSTDPFGQLVQQQLPDRKSYAQKATENIYKELGETTPQNMTTGQWMIYNSTIGILKTLPILVGAKLLGAPAAVGGGAKFLKQLFTVSKAGLALSGMSAAEKYNELVTQGTDEKKAAAAAISYGAISYFAEKIPIERMLNPATSKGIKNLFINMLGETAAEVITEIGHHVTDIGMMGEDKTVGDLMERIKDTAILTPLVTGVISPILVRVPNIRDTNRLKINKAAILMEINRNNQIVQDMPLNQKLPDVKGIDFNYSNYNIDKDGVVTIAKDAVDFIEMNGLSSETVEGFKRLLSADPTTADMVSKIPEKSIEQKIKSFVDNGTFTIGLASDLSPEDINVYSDMGNRMLKINELANMDLPEYITQEVIDMARNKKINELISQGIVDVDNHPSINILDNIDKRLSMRERDIKRYRKENSLSMKEQIDFFKSKSDDIEIKHQEIAKKIMDIDKLENKLNNISEVINDPSQINKLKEMYEDVNIMLDEVSNTRKMLTERLNRMTDNKKLVIENNEKIQLSEMLKKNVFDNAIDTALNALTTAPETVTDKLKIQENIDLKGIKDKDVRELTTQIVNDILETRDIRQKIRDTKDKELRKNYYEQIDVKKEKALESIKQMNETMYKTYDVVKFLETSDQLSEKFVNNFSKLSTEIIDIYNEIVDIVDTKTFFKDLRQNTEMELDSNVDRLNKLISDYDLKKNTLMSSISNIKDNINKIKVQAGIIKNIDPSIFGMDLQMFGAETIDDASKYIEDMYSKYSKNSEILPDLDVIKNAIKKVKDTLKKDNYDNWNNATQIKKKPEHFNIYGLIAKEFTQPHNINNEIYQAAIDGIDDIMVVGKSRKQNEITNLMAQFNKLSFNEKVRLYETAMAKSNSLNKVFTFAEFKSYIESDDILSKNPEKYFQAYEAYKRGMDRAWELMINPLIEKYPDLADTLKKTRHNYYLPLKRKPGNFQILVKEAGKNTGRNWFYGEYQTKSEADKVLGDIKSGKKILSPDNKTFVKIDPSNIHKFDFIAKESTTTEKLKNISKYLLGIFPEKNMYKTRNEWSDYITLTDSVEMSIDQAVYNMINSENYDPNNPGSFDSLSKSIKDNLLKINRVDNSLGNLFLEQKGVAGLETEQALENINEAITKAVNSATRFELLDYHKKFIENNFKNTPSDIKNLINRYYEANIDNPDVYHQLAAKVSYANVMYHIGGSMLTAIKNIATAPPMILSLGGEYGINPIQTSKHMLTAAPKTTKFIVEYGKRFLKDMVFNSGTGTENLTEINQIALDSGFSEKEAHFLVRMFRDGYITTGITSEFDSVYLGALNSNFKKTANGLMTPFKLSEIAVRSYSSIVTANALIEGGKFNSLDDPGITKAAYKLVNRHQPRGGIGGRIIGTQRKGIVGAALRASTSLINFTFNYGATLYDQSVKAWDVMKKEKGLDKITKNNYLLGLGAYAGSMVLMGGAKTLPFSEDARRLYRQLFKDDDIITRIDDNNSAISRMVNGGLLGLMYVDVPGLGIGVPVSVGTGGAAGTMYRNIASGLSEATAGAYYGNWDKVYRGLETSAPSLIKRIMRTSREYFYGLSTKDGVKLIDPETREQRTLSGAEALIKLTGLNLITKNYSDAQMKRMANEMSAIYNGVKRNVINSARRHINNGNGGKAMEEIRAFNEQVIKYYRKNKKMPTSLIKSLTTEKVE